MKRQNHIYGIKNFGLEVKDFDEGSRKVSGYLSAFDVVDSDRDVIKSGSFAKSISERGPKSGSNRKIAFLRMHKWENQIGKFLELEEDGYGLKFVAQLGTSSKGEDALRDYQEGILKEHSIGFRYVHDKMEYDEDKDVFEIKELNLFEGSAVTFGANEFTPVLDVAKGLEGNQEAFKVLFDEHEAIEKALKNGKGSDERLYALEMRSKALRQKYMHFFSTLKPLDDTSTKKENAKREAQERKSRARKFHLSLLTT